MKYEYQLHIRINRFILIFLRIQSLQVGMNLIQNDLLMINDLFPFQLLPCLSLQIVALCRRKVCANQNENDYLVPTALIKSGDDDVLPI